MNIKFLNIIVKLTNSRLKLTLTTTEIHSYTHIGFFTISHQSKKISNDQELQSDPISCPQNQKGNINT